MKKILGFLALLSLEWNLLFAQAAGTSVPTPHQQATAAGSPGQGFMSMLPMLVIIVLVFYFMIIRPQSKRAKEHKSLMDNLKVGDEIITSAGIVGKISRFREHFVEITIADNVNVTIQKAAISTILPKGTSDSMQ